MSTLADTIDAAEELLADCPTFQTLVGAATATVAKASIYQHAPPEPADPDGYTAAELDALRPMAILHVGPGSGLQVTVNDWSESGRVFLEIYRTAPSTVGGEPDQAAHVEWFELLADLYDELKARSGLSADAAFLFFRTIQRPDEWIWQADPAKVAQEGIWQGAGLELIYGDGE